MDALLVGAKSVADVIEICVADGVGRDVSVVVVIDVADATAADAAEYSSTASDFGFAHRDDVGGTLFV